MAKRRINQYLMDTLGDVRKHLSHLKYATLYQALTEPDVVQTTPTLFEGMAINWAKGLEEQQLKHYSDDDLCIYWDRLQDLALHHHRRTGDYGDYLEQAARLLKHLEQRGVEVQSSLMTEVRKVQYGDSSPGGKKSGKKKPGKRKKGFLSRDSEGGLHAHGLSRSSNLSLDDGAHAHVFLLPGTNDFIFTQEDGSHVHELSGDTTAEDGMHSHSVFVAGTQLQTKVDGAHGHELMVETSGFGGLHQHVLVLPDGTEITSLTPSEFIEKFGGGDAMMELPGAHAIVAAVHDVMFEPLEAFDVFMREDTDLTVYEGDDVKADVSIGEFMAYAAKRIKSQKDLKIAIGENVGIIKLWEYPVALVTNIDGDTYHAALTDGDGWCEITAKAKIKDVTIGDLVEIDPYGEVPLIRAFKDQPGPDSIKAVEAREKVAQAARESFKLIDFSGSADAPVVFVSASPNALEIARGEAIVGFDGEFFNEHYLGPLGLTRKDVQTGFAVPRPIVRPTDEHIALWAPWLLQKLEKAGTVVALGKLAKRVLGDRADFSLPHPSAVRRFGDSGEVTRKLKAIKKRLDEVRKDKEDGLRSGNGPSQGFPEDNLADARSELHTGDALVPVTKSVEEQQIVYGVVLDPYRVDAHNDWTPPAEVERSAHDFLTESRVIGLQHNAKAEAELVESWVEPYPSPEDYQKAMRNEPHSVYERRFGDDVIHSGTWVAGVRLGDAEWEMFKQGKVTAFSPGGFSFRDDIEQSEMPDVQIVKLVEGDTGDD